MRAPITDKHLLEMMWERFPEIMRRGTEQPAQQEPVAFLDWYDNAHWGNEDFKDGCWRAWDAALEHTSPPAQRTWVGLTDKDITQTFDEVPSAQNDPWWLRYAKAIEAKLKEKNT